MYGYRGPGPVSESTGVSFGVELWPPNDSNPGWGGRSKTLTGMRLRAALDTIVNLDPRFEWREMNGVIVIRPIVAWVDSTHQLAQPFDGFFGNTNTEEAITILAARMGPERTLPYPYRDSKPLLLEVPPGTVMDFVNGIARAAHGGMMWRFNRVWCCGTPRYQGPAGEQYELGISSGTTGTSFWVK